MKTNQEILDIVANHLLNQNEKATIGATTANCAYRGNNGKKCAIGILIPDEEYTEDLEGCGITYNKRLRNLPCMQGLDMNFLYQLQMTHDVELVNNWRPCLENLAKRNNLKINF